MTDCISEINNTQVGNVKNLDFAMRMYSLIEYSDNYSKSSLSFRPFASSFKFEMAKFFEVGQLKNRLKQLHLEQDPGFDTR